MINDYWVRQVESGNSNGVGSEKGKNEANEAGMVGIRLNGGSMDEISILSPC